MNIPEFDLLYPANLREAAANVADGAIPYCGGTELLAVMGMGFLRPDRLVSLRLLPELRGQRLSGATLILGATMTHREVASSGEVASAAPLLGKVAGRVGNVRVRATGTIGGNLAFAEPRSDISTVLIALGATVVVSSAAGGERRMPIREFVRAAFETELRDGELIIRVEVPARVVDVAIYQKIVFSERPVVGVAVTREAATGAWRLVVGAVGEVPTYLELADLADADAEGIAASIEVVADLSGSKSYKRHLTEVAIRRACEQARAEARGSAA